MVDSYVPFAARVSSACCSAATRKLTVKLPRATLYPAFCQSALPNTPDSDTGEGNGAAVGWKPQHPIVDATADLPRNDAITGRIAEDLDGLVSSVQDARLEFLHPVLE